MSLNRPLLTMCRSVKLTLHNGETIEGVANYSDAEGMEIFVAERDEFVWVERRQIQSRKFLRNVKR